MSLCARCGLNEPLPEDKDDFCKDCALEAELIMAEIEERRRESYWEMEFAVEERRKLEETHGP